jgi:hypothetical protein
VLILRTSASEILDRYVGNYLSLARLVMKGYVDVTFCMSQSVYWQLDRSCDQIPRITRSRYVKSANGSRQLWLDALVSPPLFCFTLSFVVKRL